MKIIALATSYNRRNLTLRSIDSLINQSLPAGFSLEICLVDDGSTDGTCEAIKSMFPDVTILKGNGNLYWAGGMRFGWDNYVKKQDMDFLLVFNDDVRLFENSIEKLIAASSEIQESGDSAYAISAAFIKSGTNETAYGGVVRSSSWHPLRFKKVIPKNTIQDCDTLNMNLALISVHALNLIGFFSRDFIHGRADYDFGLRLRSAGGRVLLAPNFLGECNKNPIKGTSDEPGLSVRERWKRLTSIKEQPPRERAIYYRAHAGLLWPLFWVLPYIRVLLRGK